MARQVLALEARLRACRNVLTIGVHPNFCDYGEQERHLIRSADKIYYPTAFYAELFDTLGKATFPSYHTYKCVQDKIKQSALFQLAGLPHLRTRVFFGKRQRGRIRDYFSLPLIAKEPRGSAMGRGVFLIRNDAELDAYTRDRHVVYIQEFLPMDRDIRAVVIGGRVVHAYWRIASAGEFRTNVARGGRVSLDPVPQAALDLALETATVCRWDDVGLDICCHDGQYTLLEANMKYGREGFRAAGIDYFALMEQLIDNGEI
ncbi:ATP-grasp domain-containing protein [Desulfosarcina ovata]|uniref:ATP-grasp domain-containing protein n=1 Tax=Desulfosarcina ovata TaxID=83564 RepID=UPI0012D31273|nr:RimK family alpha-L-glutamate ligase [Desulfosarcina ovata]